MVMYWIAVAPSEADDLVAERVDAWDLLEAPGRSVDVDKAWHAVHAVLTGRADEDDSVLGRTVFGGTEFGEDEGYGPARLLSAADVTEVSGALDELGPVAFEDRVDLATLAALSIYPFAFDDAEEASELRAWLLDSFVTVADAYRAAAAGGQAMVVLCG